MPVRVSRRGGRYRVTHGRKLSAKGTTKAKATAQARLLRAIGHGWKPTTRRAR